MSEKVLRLSDGKLESDRIFCPQTGKSSDEKGLHIEEVCNVFIYAHIHNVHTHTLQTHIRTISMRIYREHA